MKNVGCTVAGLGLGARAFQAKVPNHSHPGILPGLLLSTGLLH